MAGGVAELAHVGAAGEVERPPQRLARDRDEQVAARRRGPSRRPCARDRGRARAPRSRRRGRTRRRRTAASRRRTVAELEVRRAARVPTRPASFGSSRSMPDDPAVAELLRPTASVSTPSPQPTSSTEPGAGAREQLVERALEAGHQPAHDRVASSRTCRRCCRSGPRRRPLGGRVIPRAPRGPARSGLAGAGARARRRRRPARSARARRRAGARSAARARSVRCESVRWAASRSPITPERAEQHRGDEQHRAEDQRLDVARGRWPSTK